MILYVYHAISSKAESEFLCSLGGFSPPSAHLGHSLFAVAWMACASVNEANNLMQIRRVQPSA